MQAVPIEDRGASASPWRHGRSSGLAAEKSSGELRRVTAMSGSEDVWKKAEEVLALGGATPWEAGSHQLAHRREQLVRGGSH